MLAVGSSTGSCSVISSSRMSTIAETSAADQIPTPTQKPHENPLVRATLWIRSLFAQRPRVGERDRGEDRDPDRAADLLRRGQKPGREAGIVILHACERGDRERDVRERKPDADRDEAGQQVDGVRAVRADLRVPEHPGDHQAETGHQHRLDADPGRQHLRGARCEDRRARRGEERESGLEHREAQDGLHVEGQQQERAEDAAGLEQRDEVRRRQQPDPEDAERHQRRTLAGLPEHEPDEQRHGENEHADRLERRPALVRRLRDGVDEADEPAGDENRPERVVLVHDVLAAALAHVDRRQHEHGDADRDVDPEDPLPAEVLREDAAEEHARRRAAAGDPAPGAECLVALLALGERRRDDRERGRRHDRRAEALHRAGADQHCRRGREAADEGRRGEEREAAHEDHAAPEEVGGTTAEEQEAAIRERVGGDHPLEVLGSEVEIGADRRQRDVHDRDVEHHDEDRGTNEDERLPAARVRCDGVHSASRP